MLGPVSISLPTLVIELFIFLATVGMMERLVFQPIRYAWAERDRNIQEGLASSTEGRDEAERAADEVREILSRARREAQGKIDEATTAGGEVRDTLVAQASEEFRRLVEQARAELSVESARSRDTLQQRVVDIALLAASHVTGQSFDQPQVRELAATVVQRESLAKV